MAVLLKDRAAPEREKVIASIASETTGLSTPAMLEDGKFTFPQEAYVGVALK
jgi:hypothetical protein